MKTNFFLAGIVLASVAFTSCSNDIDPVNNEQLTVNNEQKAHLRLSISTGMDVTTRAALTANDKPLTDIYIMDYDKTTGALLQVLHQTSTATDFAEPDLTLDYGQHTLKVIATRATTPTLLDATSAAWQHTTNQLCAIAPGASDTPVAFSSAKMSDTFGAQQDVTVAAGQTASVSITLDRLVAKLTLDIKDEFPTGCSDVQLSLNEHTAFSLTAFDVMDAVANQRTTNVSDLAGTTGTKLTFFFLTPSGGTTTDITFTMNRTQGTPFAQFTVPAVPLDRNKVTTISGSFYNHQQGFQLTVNDAWDAEGNNINI